MGAKSGCHPKECLTARYHTYEVSPAFGQGGCIYPYPAAGTPTPVRGGRSTCGAKYVEIVEILNVFATSAGYRRKTLHTGLCSAVYATYIIQTHL